VLTVYPAGVPAPLIYIDNLTHTGANTSSLTITYPSNISAGDLIVCFISTDKANTPSFPAHTPSWTVLNSTLSGTSQQLDTAYVVADGTETGTFVVSVTSGNHGAICFVVKNWSKNTANIEVNTSTASSVTVDPPSISPAWGAKTALIVSCGAHRRGNIASLTYSYSENQTNDFTRTSAAIALSSTVVSSSSVDPPSFVMATNSDRNVGATLAIKGL